MRSSEWHCSRGGLRLVLFTTLWTVIWVAPLPKLSRRVELVARLIPFAAFGLREFGACFIGVPADDRVRMAWSELRPFSRLFTSAGG